jgi:hypothetical protein
MPLAKSLLVSESSAADKVTGALTFCAARADLI